MHRRSNSAPYNTQGPSEQWWRDVTSSVNDGALRRPQHPSPASQPSLQGSEISSSGPRFPLENTFGMPAVRDRWTKMIRRGGKKNRQDRPNHGNAPIDIPRQQQQQQSWVGGGNRGGRSVRRAIGPKRGGGGSRGGRGGGFQDGGMRTGQAGGGFWKPKPDAKLGRRDWDSRTNSGNSSRTGSMDHRGKRGDEWHGRQLREWTLKEGLEEWAWSPGKYTFGFGHKSIVLERDAEPGVWRVSPAFGCRFSPSWLEAISEWVVFFRQALLEHRMRKQHRKRNSLPGPLPGPASGSTQHSLQSYSSQPSQFWPNIELERANSVDQASSGAFSMPSHNSILAQLEECRRRGSWAICRTNSDVSSGLSVCQDDSFAETASTTGQILETRVVTAEEPNFQSDGGSVTGGESITQARPSANSSIHNHNQKARKCVFGEKQNLLDTDKVNVSIRCEKMGITDMEAEMLGTWIEEHKDSVNVVKLWLFDNKLTDLGAKYVTQMMHDGLMELHLSHNTMTNSGAELVVSAISTKNTIGKPLWLRMEWNMLSVDNLMKFLKKQEETRGLVIDIPKFLLKKVRGKMSSQLMNEKIDAHVQIPWIRSQRLKPSEAPVLMAAKTSWTKSRAPEPRLVQPMPSRSSPPSGPLLIFPDTSALLGLIGISRKGQRSVVFTFDWLQNLCMKSGFGKNLPANERVFFVLCDSVAKQLDGLKKQNPYVGHSIRKLMSSGLDQYGPGGDDFVTVLGAHEGEGMVVDRNAEVLDARSHNVHDKGQATDLKIVEVALFFQQELCKKPLGRCRSQSCEIVGSPEAITMDTIIPDGQDPMRFPVVLLSNDNVQLVAAKSHGLPAYRFTDFSKVRSLRTMFDGKNPLTASAIRRLMGGSATKGLGESAKKSLQGEFDGAIACIKHLLISYEGVHGVMEQIREVLQSDLDGNAAIGQLRSVLDLTGRRDSNEFMATEALVIGEDPDSDQVSSLGSCSSGNSQSSDVEEAEVPLENEGNFEETSEESGVTPSGPSYAVSEAESTATSVDLDACEVTENELVPLVRAKLTEWEGLVKSYQNPSRVLKWISGGMPSQRSDD
ncbi:hypothetical protein BSKO_08422 [Bryopsis sp. KO-2023]|nr:hypothetical protein BSKO_08422 [Bryopsis sp. KO-2023]